MAHPHHHELIGRRFGRIIVLQRGDPAKWLCLCDCGKRWQVRQYLLIDGRTKSCGCLKSDRIAAASFRHGHAKRGEESPEYGIWADMIQRCTNPNRERYPDYGGRSITVCERWRNSFEAFLADVGPRPSEDLSLDRYPNNDGNYEPGNVRWATDFEQRHNRRGESHAL